MAYVRSGMGVDDGCKFAFLELKRKKSHRYIVFKIDEAKKSVVVEKIGKATEGYDDFTASLPNNDCRYGVFDFDFVSADNCRKSKIIFVAWCPEASRIRSKFVYASSKEKFCRDLDGVHYEVQAMDPTEVGIETIRDLTR